VTNQPTAPDLESGPGERTQPIRPTFITPPAKSGNTNVSGRFDATDTKPAVAEPYPAPDHSAPNGENTGTTWPAPRPSGPPTRAESKRAAAEAKARRKRRRSARADWNRSAAAAAHDTAARSRWNALSIAAVVSILTWTPLPLILGLLAVRQTRRYGERGERLGYIGIAVGAVLLVVYGYALTVSWS
jgi:hypothetical protein